MNLILTVHMEDDAPEGHIDIYDDPCSEPYCVNMNMPAPGSLLACLVEYMVHGAQSSMCVAHRRYDGVSVYFCDIHVVIEVERRASFTVPRENIRLDMSTLDRVALDEAMKLCSLVEDDK